MATLKDLAKRIDKIRQELPDRTNQYTIDTAIDLVRELTNPLATYANASTPVDVSTAVSNWQAGTNLSSTVLDAYVKGEDGSTHDASAKLTIMAAERDLGSRKYGQEIHVFNNLDYIKKLDEGSSMQAPSGFTTDSIVRTRNNIKNRPFKLED